MQKWKMDEGTKKTETVEEKKEEETEEKGTSKDAQEHKGLQEKEVVEEVQIVYQEDLWKRRRGTCVKRKRGWSMGRMGRWLFSHHDDRAKFKRSECGFA